MACRTSGVARNPGERGPTEGTEILRGADRDLLADLYRTWAQEGQIPAEMSAVDDVANALLSFIAIARANPTVVSDIVHLAPRGGIKRN